jgi:hypothetical protein
MRINYVCKMCSTLGIPNLAITHIKRMYKFSHIISFIVQVVQWLD